MNTESKAPAAPVQPEQEKGVPFLKGERVTLRTFGPADIEKVYRWINDPAVNRSLLRGDIPMGWSDELEWVDRSRRRREESITLGIEIAEIGLIGVTGLDIQWPNRSGDTGTMIGEPSAWGKGYGTEAKMLVLSHAFRRLNLRNIYSKVYAFNERSIRCQQRCGYIEEARLKECIFRDGLYHDLVILTATRESFEAAEAAWKEKRVTQQEGLIMDFSGSAVPRLFH